MIRKLPVHARHGYLRHVAAHTLRLRLRTHQPGMQRRRTACCHRRPRVTLQAFVVVRRSLAIQRLMRICGMPRTSAGRPSSRASTCSPPADKAETAPPTAESPESPKASHPHSSGGTSHRNRSSLQAKASTDRTPQSVPPACPPPLAPAADPIWLTCALPGPWHASQPIPGSACSGSNPAEVVACTV